MEINIIHIKCGICNSDCIDYPKKTYFCSSCMNFKLLKYNLNKINLQNINSIVVNDINNVLKVCFDENVKLFLKDYIKYKENLNIQSNLSKKNDNLENTNVSKDSVAKLAFMLINVDINKTKRNIKTLDQLVNLEIDKCNKIEEKIRILKNVKDNKQKLINKLKNECNLKLVNEKINKIHLDIENFKINIINKQNNYLINKQLNEIYNLIFLWNIKIINNNKLSILYSPILPINGLIKYSTDLILNSIIKTSLLIDQLYKILRFKTPFEINNFKNNILIGDISIKFNEFNEILNINQLNNIQLIKFSVCLSRLILNIIILLIRIDNNFKIEDENMSFLFNYDKLIIKIINKITNFKTNNEKINNKLKNENLINKNSLSWKQWFFTKKNNNKSEIKEIDKVDFNIIPRYQIENIKEYNEILHSNLIGKLSINDTLFEKVKAFELIHNERLLSQEIHKILEREISQTVFPK